MTAQVVVEPDELDVARSHPAACEYVDTFAPGEEEGWAPCSAYPSLQAAYSVRHVCAGMWPLRCIKAQVFMNLWRTLPTINLAPTSPVGLLSNTLILVNL
jgi:hypothetical protein